MPGTKEMTIYKRTKKEIFLDFYFILHCVWLQLRKEKTKYQGEGYDIEKKKKTNISSIYACKYKIGMK